MNNSSDFREWLKNGKVSGFPITSNENETGGFLVPEYINVPNPGLIAWFWRTWGSLQIKFGYYGSGYLAFIKGTHDVNLQEILLKRINE